MFETTRLGGASSSTVSTPSKRGFSGIAGGGIAGDGIAGGNASASWLLPRVGVWVVGVWVVLMLASPCLADDPPAELEAAITAYTDAANFQTGGAIDVAIEAWNDFLGEHPESSLASKARHYLGVCHMQSEQPDYGKAADAFERALRNEQHELREESLANYGWCLLATGTNPAGRTPAAGQTQILGQVIEVYQTLRQEYPESQFLDRAYFYSAEAAYQLGDISRAIGFYDNLLSLDQAGVSPLRCDALYARGVALQQTNQMDRALASYQQFLDGCADPALAADVLIRMGDLHITRKAFGQALAAFDKALSRLQPGRGADRDAVDPEANDAAGTDRENLSYAIFRSAYALVQSDRPAEAAERYHRLAKEFPNSSYADAALLASAQSFYRSGDLDKAAEVLRVVARQSDLAAATEATHWLARIAITRGDPTTAVSLARDRIELGTQGDFAVDLQVDLAEALSLDPDTASESMTLYENIFRDDPTGRHASAALYDAALTGLQSGDAGGALRLAELFLKQFSDDQSSDDRLADDVRSVAAEAHLVLKTPGKASEIYQGLLRQAPRTDPRRRTWVLRAAAAMVADREFAAAVALVDRNIASFDDPQQKADALLLAGQAQLQDNQFSEAAKSFGKVSQIAPDGPRHQEALWLRGRALAEAGKSDQARQAWMAAANQAPSSALADQAKFKLAELAAADRQQEQAVALYQEIAESDRSPGLRPYAKYAVALSRLQSGDYAAAASLLDDLAGSLTNHPLESEILLSLGIARRNLAQYPLARKHLAALLDRRPAGEKLGHALFEMALVDIAVSKPAQAIANLRRLTEKVPDYSDMDKVRYELGWALRENQQTAQAITQFELLVSEHPASPLLAEAAYLVGQQRDQDGRWADAAGQYSLAADRATDPGLREKALYQLGWAWFRSGDYAAAQSAFADQVRAFDDGSLRFDASRMIAECHFERGDYAAAMAAYTPLRKSIQDADETSQSLRDAAQRQTRELVLLRGGQSAAQLARWDDALGWYDELRDRFPSSHYLPQTFYETGFAYQQKGDNQRALKFLGQVAGNYRNLLAARARFLMGEIHFSDRAFDLAIPEFQRVMFGFGAQQAPQPIKNWQAKSGFEAGRCGEQLMLLADSETKRQKAARISRDFYTYVTASHPDHELAAKARKRLRSL